jgi:thiamine-monophosphate kinase
MNPMSEFSLIQRYFNRPSQDTDLAIGDDAALISLAENEQLAISTDMLVSGTHFFADAKPADIGWKSLAVNLSDMAAMGALAKWATLAIALPNMDESWLSQFSQGLFDCAAQFGVSVIGGDTTKGPLAIAIQIMGTVPKQKALQRNGAQTDDEIWHSGDLGSAAYALALLQQGLVCPQAYADKLHRPQPRMTLGLALRGIANSAIDISDGLLADLQHILEASGKGADIHWPNVRHQLANIADAMPLALSGGDDYELCFTAPASAHNQILQLSQQLNLPLTCIGRITATTGLNVWNEHHQAIQLEKLGYDHFRTSP